MLRGLAKHDILLIKLQKYLILQKKSCSRELFNIFHKRLKVLTFYLTFIDDRIQK